MIQLYYLAAPEREHRFDAVFGQLDAVVTFFSLASIPSLTGFLARDKMVDQQDYILCDLDGAEWSDEHILSAVQTLRRFSVAHMVFLSPSNDHTTILYQHLAEQRVDGLIVDDGDPSGTIAAALQGDSGYMHRLSAIQRGVVEAANREVTPLRIVPGLVLDVAVCGAMPRVGATTQAIALYHYLSQLGFRPVILEQEGSIWETVRELYQDKVLEMDRYSEVNGIRLTTERSEDFNAYITDYGVLEPGRVKTICAADLTVLIGGVKPWELPYLASAYNQLKKGEPRELVTLLSFASPEGLADVREFLGDCAALSYHPDLWIPGSDTVYRSVILPHLVKICGGG